jgi:AcrR family transcriptional regulator
MSTRRAESGRSAQRNRTRQQILRAAADLIEAGRSPTVTEAADAATVSRRTAYRYFPNPEKLIAEAALERLRPAFDAAFATAPAGTSDRDMEARVVALVRAVQKLTLRHETLLRTMVHATVTERPRGAPLRGTRRIEWIDTAIGPLRARLGDAAYERLVSSLAVCIGIEAALVLKDVRALGAAAAVETCEWMALALLRAALREARSTARAGA